MVAGCQVTTKNGAYFVVIALREGDTVTDVLEWPGPRGETEADALAGLRVRVRDVLRDRKVSRLALWQYEGGQHATIKVARPAIRAEGVVLAAAGQVPGVEVVEVSPASERKKAALKTEPLVDSRLEQLDGSWSEAARRAVAASTFA